jgi:carbon-monoxide dehydrogenase small subunit
MLTLTVNGETVTADIAPRTHLADFLREALNLTGTHLGCEHGVCGACTVLIDGAPARACINFAALCEGADIVTIEGLSDPLTARLRAAFTAEHALQCGFCTPGMLVTARDVLIRLPGADQARIRLELAGNLCRCTGYEGIVRAIMRVQAQGLDDPPVPAPLPAAVFAPAHAAPPPAALPAAALPSGAPGLTRLLHLAVPVEQAWDAVQDIGLIANCVPGLVLARAAPDDLAGTLTASFGPISARFAGTGRVAYGDRQGTITAQGRDVGSRTALTVQAQFTVRPAAAGAQIEIEIAYSLRGPLAQLARPAIVSRFAAEILAQIAARLDARLTGQTAPPEPQLGLLILARAMLWRWWRGLASKTPP